MEDQRGMCVHRCDERMHRINSINKALVLALESFPSSDVTLIAVLTNVVPSLLEIQCLLPTAITNAYTDSQRTG